MKKQYLFLILFATCFAVFSGCAKKAEYKALIITGQNNHNWKVSSPILKMLLEQTGLFTALIVAVGNEFSISVASLDSAIPAVLVHIALYILPLSAMLAVNV